MTTSKNPEGQCVTVLKQVENNVPQFQIVPIGADQQFGPPIHTCRIRGDATAWLVCNGYTWIENSEPEQWTKKG
jgi:hypothetical protein